MSAVPQHILADHQNITYISCFLLPQTLDRLLVEEKAIHNLKICAVRPMKTEVKDGQ